MLRREVTNIARTHKYSEKCGYIILLTFNCSRKYIIISHLIRDYCSKGGTAVKPSAIVNSLLKKKKEIIKEGEYLSTTKIEAMVSDPTALAADPHHFHFRAPVFNQEGAKCAPVKSVLLSLCYRHISKQRAERRGSSVSTPLPPLH